MPDSTDRRKELRAEYRETPRAAGVYQISHASTGKVLVASAVNLASARNRFDFAKASGSVGALDGRLAADIREHGMDALAFEVLETIKPPATMTAAQLREELSLLEGLWRERIGAEQLY